MLSSPFLLELWGQCPPAAHASHSRWWGSRWTLCCWWSSDQRRTDSIALSPLSTPSWLTQYCIFIEEPMCKCTLYVRTYLLNVYLKMATPVHMEDTVHQLLTSTLITVHTTLTCSKLLTSSCSVIWQSRHDGWRLTSRLESSSLLYFTQGRMLGFFSFLQMTSGPPQ